MPKEYTPMNLGQRKTDTRTANLNTWTLKQVRLMCFISREKKGMGRLRLLSVALNNVTKRTGCMVVTHYALKPLRDKGGEAAGLWGEGIHAVTVA
jgi:hypothetical protein